MLPYLANQWLGGRDAFLRYYRLFFGLLASRIGTQAINALTAFLIIQRLSKDSYASYTIVNTIGPTLLLLSDTGIGGGLTAIGRHFWEDNERMGSLVNTGLQMRRQFAVGSFILVGPALMWMLLRNHVDLVTIMLLVAITLAGTSLQLSSSVLRMVLSLRTQFKVLVWVGMISTLTRLALIAIFAFGFHLNAVLATLAATCALGVEIFFDIRAVKPQIAWTAPPNPEYRKTIYGLVRKTLPLTLYFCLQSHISIWLISVFGSGHQVADIGAAGRIGMVFSTVSGTYAGLIVPRFARNNGRERLLSMLFQIMAGLMLIVAGSVTFAWLFPQPFLLLLGAKYDNMAPLIWVVMLSSGLASLAGLSFGLNMTKGWVPPAVVTIPCEVATQIILLVTLNLTTTRGVLFFACLAALTPLFLNIFFLIRNICREEK